jgi:hypothetical protein
MTDAPFGVSLAAYAGITSALGEGHSLEAVLAAEAIALDAWRAAEPAWKVRLAASASRGDAEFTAFRARTFEAEDALARRVAPLDVDLVSWLSFVAAWGSAAEPADFLEQHGLRPSDVSRLRRAWDARFEREPALAVKAARLVAGGQLGPVPTVEADRPRLRPFPWSRRSMAERASSTSDGSDEGRSLDSRYLDAHRRVREAMVGASLPAPSPAPRLAPSLAAPWPATPSPAPGLAPPVAPLVDATSPFLPAVALEPLPFVAAASSLAAPPTSGPPIAAHPDVGETVELAALSDAALFGSPSPGHAAPEAGPPNLHATAILDASALGDLDTAVPFARRST